MKYEKAKMDIVYFDGDVYADLTVSNGSGDSEEFSKLFGGDS